MTMSSIKKTMKIHTIEKKKHKTATQSFFDDLHIFIHTNGEKAKAINLIGESIPPITPKTNKEIITIIAISYLLYVQ